MKTKFTLTSLILSTILFSLAAGACQWHRNAGMGGYSQFHPLMRQHFNPEEFAVIELTAPQILGVVNNKKALLELNYAVPVSFSNVKVEVNGSDAISFVDVPAKQFTGLRGKYPISFNALQSGDHEIVVKVTATRDGGLPVAVEKKVKIHSV